MSERIICPWCGSRDVIEEHLGRCELTTKARGEAVTHGRRYGIPDVTTTDLWAHLGHIAAPPDMTRIVRQVLDLGWRPVVGSDTKRLWRPESDPA